MLHVPLVVEHAIPYWLGGLSFTLGIVHWSRVALVWVDKGLAEVLSLEAVNASEVVFEHSVQHF